MAEREKYCIAVDGQVFEVSKELYEAYYKGRRKEKYFANDLKEERTRVGAPHHRAAAVLCHKERETPLCMRCKAGKL